MIGGERNQVVNTNFNFKDCNIDLQGALNELAQKLSKKGNQEDAEELKEAAELLETIKDSKSKEEVKKKGIAKRLGRIAKDLGDKDSTLYKTVEGLKRGADIAQDFAKEYNKIAQWLGLPQVPKPFLKD